MPLVLTSSCSRGAVTRVRCAPEFRGGGRYLLAMRDEAGRLAGREYGGVEFGVFRMKPEAGRAVADTTR